MCLSWISSDHAYGAAIIYKSNVLTKPIVLVNCNEIAALEIACLNRMLGNIRDLTANFKDAVICINSDIHNRLWGSQTNDRDGITLEDFLVSTD